MASDLIKHVSDASFKADVLDATSPVLVDFWAEWCGPCKMIAPILDEVAGSYNGKLQIAKVNVDENPGVSQAFRVMSIPTLILFKDGREIDRKAGAMTADQIIAWSRQALNRAAIDAARAAAGHVAGRIGAIA